jgi:Ca2+-binding RTX toxin-like protein
VELYVAKVTFPSLGDHFAFEQLRGFKQLSASEAAVYSWINEQGDEVDVIGEGFTYGNSQVPTGGTVSEIRIDMEYGGVGVPDVLITQLSFNLSAISDITKDNDDVFWSTLLSGNDTIDFGTRPAYNGDTSISLAGDFRNLTSSTTEYAGDDLMTGRAGSSGYAYGDAFTVGSSSILYGGDDTIEVSALRIVGDAQNVFGTLYGGHDTMSQFEGYPSSDLVGDAVTLENGKLFGGNDNLTMGFDGMAYGDVGSSTNAHFEGGNDTIYGGGGSEEIYGDARDIYSGFARGGSDTLYGGLGDDWIYGDWLSDSSEAERIGGNDKLYGGNGNDELWGNQGDDLLDGGTGVDTLIGNEGNDTFIVDRHSDVVMEFSQQGTADWIKASATYRLRTEVRVEKLSTTSNSGTAAIDLYGNELSQEITGNAGANALVGGGGGDILNGGAGIDAASYITATKAVVANLLAPSGNTNDAVGDTYLSIENLTGSDYSDTLTGNAGANTLTGGEGNDILSGRSGADRLIGGEGTDTASYAGATKGVVANLKYASGNTNDAQGDVYSSIENLTGSVYADTLKGDDAANRTSAGSGNDIIYGLLGNDLLVGGLGADTFVFDTRLGSDNIDTIDDFVASDDTIWLDRTIFTRLGGAGGLAAQSFYAGAAVHDASDRIIYDKLTGKLYYDADGTGGGAAVQFALLDKNLTLTASDFDIIA